jgi:hypothetical protein
MGRSAKKWTDDLDWLFDARDGIVHHGDELRQRITSRVTNRTLVASAPEAYSCQRIRLSTRPNPLTP